VKRRWPIAVLAAAPLLLLAFAAVEPTPIQETRLVGPVESARDIEDREVRRLALAAGETDSPAELTVDYPPAGAIVPAEFHPPTFLWHDTESGARRWLLELAFDGGATRMYALVDGGPPPRGEIDERCISVTNALYEPTPYQASAESWRPSAGLWATIKARSVETPVRVTLHGFRPGSPKRMLSRGSVEIRTAPYPVGAPIFYRDVPLMPSATAEGVIKPLDKKAQPLIVWRLRDVARDESRVLLRNMPTCANCHSFSADGRTLGMDVDGPQGDKGAYALATIEPNVTIRDEQILTWNAFPDKPRGFNTLGFMARVSPDGSKVVATVNEALYVRNFWDYRFSQVFYPTRGVLAWYDRGSGEIRPLPGADDPAFVHCNPVWTPDGESLVFARAAARDPYAGNRSLATYAGDPNETPMRYDLYRIPFNGGRGGEPQPIAGASANGMSNSFPKISPDGRWIVWVQSKNGLLMRPDSKLWIVPAQGGEARELASNLPLMNSWHSFSPNGRWLVFSSKSNTPYTQMFLTHLDEEGNASPPLLIENSTAANRAVNIPEFVNVRYDDFLGITVPAVDHYEHFQRGNDLARAGRLDEAVAAYREALGREHKDWRVNDWRIHDSLSKVLLRVGESDLALRHIRESLRLNPYNAEMYSNLGYVLAERGETEEALAQLHAAARLAPRDPKIRFNRGTLLLQLGDTAAAAEDYDEALRLNPRYLEAYVARGLLRRQGGDLDGALADLDAAVELNPGNPSSRLLRAGLRLEAGDAAGALEDVEAARIVAPPDWERSRELDAVEKQARAAVGGSG
jgi:tetratricopeptide (TPR) repeat protein